MLDVLKKAKSYKGKRNIEIAFEKSTYVFGGDYAPDIYVFTSNNDEGLKRVIFPILDFENVTINGNGHTISNMEKNEKSDQYTFQDDIAACIYEDLIINISELIKD